MKGNNKTNRLILGTMTIGPSVDLGARVTSLETYQKCLDYLKSKGYLELDTAAIYVGGLQEAFTRDAGYQQRGFSIASKIMPVTAGDHSPQMLREHWDVSLQKLGASCADILYLHAPDRSVPYETTLEAVNQLHQEGKFKQLGLSNYASWEVAEMVGICEKRGFVRPSVYQGMYNAISRFPFPSGPAHEFKVWMLMPGVARQVEEELIPCLRKFNISFIVYNPLAGGIFSGKYTTLDNPAEGRFSNEASETGLGALYRSRYFRKPVLDALGVVEPVAAQHNTPLIEVALRWMVHHSSLKMKNKGGEDGIVLGISSYQQLVQNVEACEKGPLPDEVVETLDKAWGLTRGEASTYWR